MKLNINSLLKSRPVADWTAALPVNKNYSWAKLCGTRNPNDLTTIAIHHDALPKYKFTEVSDLELASRIANNHIRDTSNHKQGDPGFPYHIWIRNGQAFQCNSLLDFTYGVSSNNGYTIHVCVSGEYKENDALTDDDRNVLLSVINSLLHHDGLPNLKEVKGHGEINPTRCPGFDMDRLRQDVVSQWVRAQVSNSIEERRGVAYLVKNQTDYMYSFIGKEDGNEEWALHYFEKLMTLMKQDGWFK